MANVLIGIGIFATGLFVGIVVGSLYITKALVEVHAKYKKETGNDFIAYADDELYAKRLKRDED